MLLALASGVCQSLKGELGPKFIEGGFSLSLVCSAQPVVASTCLIISTFKIAFCLSGSEKSPDWDDFCFHLRIILSALPLQSEKCSGAAEMEWEEAAKIHSHSLAILMSLLGISGHLLPRLFPDNCAVKYPIFACTDNLGRSMMRDISEYKAWYGLQEELQMAMKNVSKVR